LLSTSSSGAKISNVDGVGSHVFPPETFFPTKNFERIHFSGAFCVDLEKATSSGCLPWSLEASKVGKLHLFKNLSHHWAMFGLDTLAVSDF